MADKKASQSQHGTVWMEQIIEQTAALEEKGLEQARTAIEESARMMKETLEWSARLSAEWRRLVFDSAKRFDVRAE